jgi:hypothetical protein
VRSNVNGRAQQHNGKKTSSTTGRKFMDFERTKCNGRCIGL